ncbi:hypothetical protein [Paenibacillus glycinis]|uniref:Copper amine oxidase-like N-terminal domain-containing protein n=1 Tax=Paenibacillus glycinis TaxID=2697035 RepID=A0ABW9XS78_9BACL|nr:hypothetical protein [Paenibacillus glycinis]NBD25515.1 hypothetical protein [Paenibacillus glycinis]
MKIGIKKKAGALLLAAIATASLPAAVSASEAGLTISINGTNLVSSANHVADGRVYVDLKSFSAFTGFTFSYDGKKHSAIVNGKEVKAVETKGTPTVAIKDLANAVGANGLSWNGKTNTAQLFFASKLVVYGDIVSELAGCVLQNRFSVGDGIVFRMKAFNPVTGKLAEDANMQVHLATGEVLDMQLGLHPPGVPGAEKFWTAKYKVTDKTPKGTLGYYVTAQSPSMKGVYKPFQVMPSLITIVDAEPAAAGASTR